MAFDTGEQEKIVTIPATPDQQEKYTAEEQKYFARLDELGAEIETAKVTLADINGQIVSAKADLAATYATKVESLGNEIQTLQGQISQLRQTSAAVAQEIVDRQATMDAISLDFGNQQAILDDRKNVLDEQFHKVDDSRRQNDADRAIINDQNAALTKAKGDFDVYVREQHAQFDGRLQELNNGQALQQRVSEAQEQEKTELNERAINLNERQERLDAANDVIAQAADIKAKLDLMVKRTAELDAQEKRNQEDFNQLRVARANLADQQAQVVARENAVKQAERKIAGG